MNAVIKKHFDKLSSSEFKCKVRTKQDDDGMEVEKTCDSIIVVGKESLWNLKRHLMRQHEEEVFKHIEAADEGFYFNFIMFVFCPVQELLGILSKMGLMLQIVTF